MKADTTKYNLFVYGTLKSIYGNNRILTRGNSKNLGNDSVRGFILMDIGGIPAATKVDNDRMFIHGETWEIDKATLDACDLLEGVGSSFYSREEIITLAYHKAFIYVQPVPDGQVVYDRIIHGIWTGINTPTIKQNIYMQPHSNPIKNRALALRAPAIPMGNHEEYDIATNSWSVKANYTRTIKALPAPLPKVNLVHTWLQESPREAIRT